MRLAVFIVLACMSGVALFPGLPRYRIPCFTPCDRCTCGTVKSGEGLGMRLCVGNGRVSLEKLVGLGVLVYVYLLQVTRL